MKLAGPPNPAACERVDAIIRATLNDAVQAERITVVEAVYLLTRMLPEFCERDFAVGHIWAAYDLANNRGKKPLMPTDQVMPYLNGAPGMVPP